MLGFSGETVIFYYHFFLNCLVTGKFSLVGYTADGSLNDTIWQGRICFVQSTVQEQCAAKEY
jgi:hypothetical protein